jgi:outer membrane lipoprotein SlyB
MLANFGIGTLACAAVLMAVGSASAQQPATVRVRGTIEAVDGQMLTIKTREGTEVKAKLDDKATIAAVTKASYADIKQGSFIGVTGMPQPDGSQKCMEIHIFPEAMRGTGEGHRPWDLEPKSTMTNATVEQVTSVGAHEINLKYKDGDKKIVVGPECPIVSYAPGDKADLKPGAKVFIGAAAKQADGTLSTTRINVGRDAAPPM